MQKLIDKFFGFLENICKIAMIVQIIVVTIIVIGRQIFNKTPAWGEEFILLCLVWFSLIGAVILFREDGHISVTAFDRYLSKKILKVTDFISYIFLTYYAIMAIKYGFKLLEITSRNMMPALRIKSSWLYASVPVSSIIMFIVLLEKFYRLFFKNNFFKEV